MTTEIAEHVHRWMLATPNGETCPATCTCGETRSFVTGFGGRAGWRNCKKCGRAYNSPQHKSGCGA